MRALWFEDGAARLRDDLPAGETPPGESRVSVRLAGVCATDLALRRGYMGFRGVPGHEFVGLAADGPLAGRRVVGDINAACGTCARCRSADPHHCPQRTVLGILGRPGCFAEQVLLPHENLVEVPEAVSDEAAVFAEPLAAALRMTEQVDLGQHQRALVAGDGRLGLLCALVLAQVGLEVVVAGRHPARAELLPDGCRHGLGLLEDGDRESRAFDLGVEATGHPDALAAMLGKIAPGGLVVLKTTSETPVKLDLAPLVVDEIRLLGSRCGPIDRALEVLASGAIDPRGLIEARYDLDHAEAALDHAARGGVLKVLIDLR